MSDIISDAVSQAELVVFDLDDTLVDEGVWLNAAYAAISRIAAPEDDRTAAKIAQSLSAGRLSHGRAGLFERVRSDFPMARGDTSSWLAAMRNTEVRGGLEIVPWALSLCETFPDKQLAILTNGNATQQRNKYRQLVPCGARNRFRLYCASDLEPKPSPSSLLTILSDFECIPEDAVFLGDHPTDRECADRAGVPFLRAPLLGLP
jgi:FMN phosphatase YigB (HAD superfamily)